MPNPSLFKTHEEYLEWYRKYREENRLRIREYNHKYNAVWKKKNGYHCEYKWMLNNPEKVKVEMKLNDAVKSGLIKRQPCEVCREIKSYGHHPDYKEPFKVIWLCGKHHRWTHLFASKKISHKNLIKFLQNLDKIKK